MRERIRGFADAVIEDVSDARRLGQLRDDLSSLRALLGAHEDLLVVLSDPGVALHARRGVVTDILGGRVGPDAERLVVFALDADRATEFAANVSWLADRVAAAGDGLVPVADGPLGRDGATERLDGYASAVLAGVPADAGGLGDLEDELFRFSRIVASSDSLRAVLGDRDLPAKVRSATVADLLASKASAATRRMAVYATQVGRPRDYPELLVRLYERVAEESERRVAEVRAPVELTAEQRGRLAAALGTIIGHPVDVRVVVDGRVLGGFVATIGDTVVDGSARHRLDQIKERLVLSEATVTT